LPFKCDLRRYTASESWVVNRHMKLGLTMMRKMAKAGGLYTSRMHFDPLHLKGAWFQL
jgi:hypothetical protein